MKQDLHKPPDDCHTKAVRRSVNYAREGFFSRAVKALKKTLILDPRDREVKKNLEDLHPKRTQEIPECPKNAKYYTISNFYLDKY